MNKKYLMVGTSIALGGILLVTTAFANVKEASGYQAYKDALGKTVEAKSFTGDMKLSLKDNGSAIMDANALVKTNEDQEFSSSITGSIKSQSEQKSFEVYEQDGKAIVKSSDSETYYITGEDQKKNRHDEYENYREVDPEALKVGEMILDALVGDLKNYVTLDEKTDGNKSVELKLTGNRIPALVNAVTSIAIKEGSKDAIRHHRDDPAGFDFNFDESMPKLVEDVRIESIELQADINKDNIIESQSIDITVTGKDAEGQVHDVSLNLDMSLSNLDNTTPDTVDLTGKQVKTIEKAEWEELK